MKSDNMPATPDLPGAWRDADLQFRMELQFRLEQFYYAEAALIDGRQFRDWLNLFSDDAHYWMPIRRTQAVKELANEFTKKGSMAFFDDNKKMLETRIKKMESGYGWPEDPPSRTRHLITNLRVVDQPRSEEYAVETNFHLYRSTGMDGEEDNWYGRRRDIIRDSGENFLIASREIYLDQTILISKNLSNFF